MRVLHELSDELLNTQRWIIATPKRSFEQGSVFTGFYLFTGGGGRWICMISLPICLPGPMFLLGCLCP